MRNSWKNNATRVLTGLGLCLLLVSVASAASHGSSEISTRDLLRIFTDSNLETARDPITFEGRNQTRGFLNSRLNSIVSSSGDQVRNSVELQTFQTKMFESPNRERTVDGVNFLAIFRGKNKTHDSPLVILANYDTDETEENPVDDNGSGIVALVALAQHVSHQIASGKLDLERTLVFAATDVALSKYKFGIPVGQQTGAESLIRQWLSSFLQGRQGFAGAIVLDSIMNFKDDINTQARHDGEISKAFPYAYQEISRRNFKGDFLAMVYREGGMDTPLVKAFERGWRTAGTSGGEVEINPGLIQFPYLNSTFDEHAPSVIHFSRSEQTPFWNRFPNDMRRSGSRKDLPALLLTDTEKYRPNECTSSGCTIRKMALESPKNVEFLRKTVNALYATIKELQVVGYQNSAPRTESYSTTFAVILVLAMHRLFL